MDFNFDSIGNACVGHWFHPSVEVATNEETWYYNVFLLRLILGPGNLEVLNLKKYLVYRIVHF